MSATLCRVLLYTSLAYDAVNTVTIELSTPRSIAPSAVLFCFTDSSFDQKADLAVQSLKAGGDLWQAAPGRELAASPSDETGLVSGFVNGFKVEVSDLDGALRGDPYYDASYTVHRCNKACTTTVASVAGFAWDVAADHLLFTDTMTWWWINPERHCQQDCSSQAHQQPTAAKAQASVCPSQVCTVNSLQSPG